MLARLSLFLHSAGRKANIKILWLSKCHNYSILTHGCLHSVLQPLCLISLMYCNYVFSVDQLSQKRETNYYHYLRLFFNFSLILFLFVTKKKPFFPRIALPGCLHLYPAPNPPLAAKLCFCLQVFPTFAYLETCYLLHTRISSLEMLISNKTKEQEGTVSFYLLACPLKYLPQMNTRHLQKTRTHVCGR